MNDAMRDAVAAGSVWHRREGPRSHAFRYRLYFSLLDVADIEQTVARCRFWSRERFNLVTFRRSDFIGPGDQTIEQAVVDQVQQALGFRPVGSIRMLTHLRQWGVCFNPVTFYFCESEGKLEAIVAEVHNTPWGERHAYVMDCRDQVGPDYRFQFDKDFHVSPFLPMDMTYDWRFKLTDQQIDVHMHLTGPDAQCFRAGMSLQLAPLTDRAMWLWPLKFPMTTLKVVVAIYWQAFRLWLKRTPFHAHPDRPVSSK